MLRISALVFSLGIVSRAYGAIPMALHRYDITGKISVVQSVVRSGGYIILAVSGFGLGHIVAWDLLTLIGTISVQAIVIRMLAPGVRISPTFSFNGLREIFGFSVFSFLTYLFFMLHRESGKMILAGKLGPTPVAYLGTPDNVSLRLHMVVASGSETLMPRFSATGEADVARDLFRNGTWSSLSVSLILLIPLIVLMPDFLSLWIDPEFALASSLVGQFVALSYISQGAYAPVATYFRGIGKPWMVTVTVLLAGLTMLFSSLILIPRIGLEGAGYSYALASVPAMLAVIHGWFYLFGGRSFPGFLRMICLPLAVGALAYWLLVTIRSMIPAMNWPILIVAGGSFAGIMTISLFGSDWLIGGPGAPSRQFITNLLAKPRVAAILHRFGFRGET
ncbi:MAG: oligosaccharide flippase family protein [Opitutaceae bacterium]